MFMHALEYCFAPDHAYKCYKVQRHVLLVLGQDLYCLWLDNYYKQDTSCITYNCSSCKFLWRRIGDNTIFSFAVAKCLCCLLVPGLLVPKRIRSRVCSSHVIVRHFFLPQVTIKDKNYHMTTLVSYVI